jgi:hypothetical protein
MTDIVERLRKWGDADKFPNPIQVINQFREERFEAANEIERLRGERDRQYDMNVSLIAENQKLRAALLSWYDACVVDFKMNGPICHGVRPTQLQRLYMETCAALEGK